MHVACLKPRMQLLCGVTGECTTMRVSVSVNMSVGDVMECLPVFIADLEDPCLLGLDYLTRVGACVDLRGGKDKGTESRGALDPRRRRSGRER